VAVISVPERSGEEKRRGMGSTLEVKGGGEGQGDVVILIVLFLSQ
jgi:hypothetical protein